MHSRTSCSIVNWVVKAYQIHAYYEEEDHMLNNCTVRSLLPFCVAALALLVTRLDALAQVTGYRFQTVPGKLIGVWPDVWTVDRLAQLREVFGFNCAVIPGARDPYRAALDAGFTPSSIVIAFGHGDGHAAVDSFDTFIYYTDEAVEHDCAGNPSAGTLYTPSELAALRDYIHLRRPGARFVSGGYKRCSHFRTLVTYTDKIMFTSYVDWTEFSVAVCNPNLGWGDAWERPWLPGANDQSPSWSWMRSNFGTKFSMTWLRGRSDEYDTLLPLANALELEGLFLYHGEPIDTTLLLDFCNAAWHNGWMYRYSDPLSVQMTSFRAVRQAAQVVRLDWATISETVNLGFYVQRRSESGQAFVDLPGGFVPGAGTTIEPRSYLFFDHSAPPVHLEYRLRQVDLDNTTHFIDPAQVGPPTGVGANIANEIVLFQNFPNPFNPSTKIQFWLGNPGFAVLRVFDVLGREIATLASEDLPRGLFTYRFEPNGHAGGVYFYQLQSGNFLETKKLVIVR